MEEDRESTRYWCYECNRSVIPILGVETVKCSSCNGDFLEEMASVTRDFHHDHHHHHHHHQEEEGGSDPDLDPDRALSLLAPLMLGMMNDSRRRRRRFTHIGFDEDEDEEDRLDSYERYRRYQFQRRHERGDSDLAHDLESVIRRRQRRSSAAFLRLVRDEIGSESETSTDRENGADSNRGRVILINPFNQTIIVQGGSGSSTSQTRSIGSLGDYFTGPALDLLLQHLAENDPNRYGTPPARKEAVEALPNVIIEENSVQCSVCLDDFEAGTEAKELPCKHRFHSQCILPWLELHSSCPVCRLELPSDESKVNQERNESTSESENVENSRRFSVSLRWPFNFFSSTSGPETGSLVTSASTSASGSGSGSGSSSSSRAHGEEDNH